MAEDTGVCGTDPFRLMPRCRIQTIMSNRSPLACGVPAREQYGFAGFPDDHEQSKCSGRVLAHFQAYYLVSSRP
jgi:hypothetical protein